MAYIPGTRRPKGRAHLPRKKRKAIRSRLAMLCKRLGLSQKEFADKFGRSKNAREAWFKKEGKSSVPDADVLISLAQDDNVNLHWLLLNRGRPFQRKPRPKESSAPGSVSSPQKRASVASSAKTARAASRHSFGD